MKLKMQGPSASRLANRRPCKFPRTSRGGTASVALSSKESTTVLSKWRDAATLSGDPITGFITRGFGVSVHKSDCPNVTQNRGLEEYAGRWVNVMWANNKDTSFKASLQIISSDRFGLLADVSSALSSMRVMIHTVNARELKNGNAAISLTIDVTSTDHLQSVITRLGKIPGVEQVSRSGQ